jgi:hypothetical protein
MSLQIIQSAFAIALLNIQHAFVGCFHDHSKAYMKFGFRQCAGSCTFSLDSKAMRKEAIILYCRTHYIKSELKRGIKIMQDQFLSNVCMTFNA